MKKFQFLLVTLGLALLSSCGNESAEKKALESSPEIDITEDVQEEAIQYEETMSDAGMLEGVNPEEIITDDWSDDGDIELETEE